MAAVAATLISAIAPTLTRVLVVALVRLPLSRHYYPSEMILTSHSGRIPDVGEWINVGGATAALFHLAPGAAPLPVT